VRVRAFLVSAWLTIPASAQVSLPRVGVPEIPLQVPIPAAGRLDPVVATLTQARSLRVERLLNEHRAELDRSPPGDLIVRAQVVGIDITEEALARARKAQFVVVRTRELADLGVKITVFETPAGMSASRGLKRLRKLDPEGAYDFNHVYLDSGEQTADAGPKAESRVRATHPGTARVGLIDGGVDPKHEVFAGIRIHQNGCDGALVPSPHGTAVADLLVSRSAVGEIFAADVYCGEAFGGAVDAVSAAFGWMASERVAVINVSLVGPRNKLMERVVKTLVSRGHLIVAAVGNDGPAAPPLYPASYDGVIGVTAVDGKHHVLIEACRGKQVDFAAQGADIEAAAGAPNVYVPVRGTSFAAPIIAMMFATDLETPDPVKAQAAFAKWKGIANDLGQPGRDDIYGEGELGDFRDSQVGNLH
jgi:hypothetical protein